MYSDSQIVNYDTENNNKNNDKTAIHRKDMDKPLILSREADVSQTIGTGNG